jgi:hypothetical protein
LAPRLGHDGLTKAISRAGRLNQAERYTMKKIINGKVYDTEKAERVGSWSNAGSWRDFQHIEEELYRKITGEYFLHGQGGPMTQYAKAEGQNSWTGGERIMPMTFLEAREWAEEHLDGDEYEGIFGEVAEDDTKVLTAFSLTKTVIEKIKREAAEKGMSMSAVVESRF